jgi:hypothetical protein
MANLWFDDGEIEAFNGTFQEEFHGGSAITKHILPHGFTIEQNLFYPASWSLLCNGNFVFHGSEDDCFIAFGSHLAGVGK